MVLIIKAGSPAEQRCGKPPCPWPSPKGTEQSWVKLERKPYMCIPPCDQFTNYSPTDSNGNTGLSWLCEAGSSFALEVLLLMPPECWGHSWMPPFLATLKFRTLCCRSTLLPTVLIILFPSQKRGRKRQGTGIDGRVSNDINTVGLKHWDY